MIKNNKFQQGFSVIEAALGIVIIAVALVLVVGLYIFLLRMSSKGVDITAATAVAEDILQQLGDQSGTDLSEALKSSQGDGIIRYGKQTIKDVPYFYILEAYPLGGEDFSGTKIAKAEIAVFWIVGDTAQAQISGISAEALDNLNDTTIDNFIETKLSSTKSKEGYGLTYIKFSKLVKIDSD